MSDESRPRADKPARKPKTARSPYHYSNWLWVIMFAVMIGGAFYPLIGFAVAICFIGAVVSGALYGRKWCGTLCPRGNFYDRVMSRGLRKPKMPAWAKSPTVRVVALVVLMGSMITQTAMAWGNWEAVGRVFVMLLAVTTGLGVLMALTGHQRAWCKVCPAGTMASWLARGKSPQLVLAPSSCTGCTACARVCPMDLGPHTMAADAAPTHSDCLKCSACVSRCPKNALSLERTSGASSSVVIEQEEAA